MTDGAMPAATKVEAFGSRRLSFEGEKMIGSLFLIEAPGRAEVEAFNRADAFAADGIWEKVTITGFLRRQG